MEIDLLYKQYFDPIKKYLTPCCGEAHAEELTQEVFFKKNRAVWKVLEVWQAIRHGFIASLQIKPKII